MTLVAGYLSAQTANQNDVKFYNLEKEYRKLGTYAFQPKKAKALELKYIIQDMLSIYGSVYVNEKSNTIYVTDVPEMLTDLQATIQQLDTEGITAGGNLVSRVIFVKHNKASSIINILNHKLSPDGQIYELADQNAIVVTDIASKIAEIEGLITGLDVVVKHISIEINIVEVNVEAYQKLGINLLNWLSNLTLYARDQTWILNWNQAKLDAAQLKSKKMEDLLIDLAKPGYSLPTNAMSSDVSYSHVISGQINVADIIDFITDDNKGKVLATSRLVTKNNNTAYLSSQEKIPYRFNEASEDYRRETSDYYVWAGIYVAVTPVVQEDRYVSLSINPRISDLTGWSPKGMPIVFERSLGTEVNVKDGETYVLGGLRKTEIVNQLKGVPLLKDIPVLRYLFSIRQKVNLTREVLMFITPRILSEQSAVVPADKRIMDELEK
jgi:type IV pilus assembly protein PilQ